MKKEDSIPKISAAVGIPPNGSTNNRQAFIEDAVRHSPSLGSVFFPRRASISPVVPRASSASSASGNAAGPRRNSLAAGARRLSRDATNDLERFTHKYNLSKSFPGIIKEDAMSLDDNDGTFSEATDTDVGDNASCADWFTEEEIDDEPNFIILEKEELEQRMEDLIESVSTQLSLSPPNAALVLQYYNWDNDKLLKEYFDHTELSLKEAGVTTETTVASSTNHEICPVCLERTRNSNILCLGCGHSYCKNCWKSYVEQSVDTFGSEIVNIPCMAPRCTKKLNYLQFSDLAEPQYYARYRYFMLKFFAESDNHIVFCPNASCGNAVQHTGAGKPTDIIECHCGTHFCFSCGQENHSPISCEELQKWLELHQDDSESMSFIKATSKPCHHCGMPTERVAGCNHIVCRKEAGGCGGEWCWMCRGDWRTHGAHTGGYYSCNTYDESSAKQLDEKAKDFLQHNRRLLHYFNRYFNHDLHMKTVQKSLADGEIDSRMRTYFEMTGNSGEFLLDAATLLVECRRLLKYTHVHSYYYAPTPLVEHHLASAEGITERLSELVYSPVETVAANSLESINWIRVATKYIHNLVHSIGEGYGHAYADPVLVEPPPSAAPVPSAHSAAHSDQQEGGPPLPATGQAGTLSHAHHAASYNAQPCPPGAATNAQ